MSKRRSLKHKQMSRPSRGSDPRLLNPREWYDSFQTRPVGLPPFVFDEDDNVVMAPGERFCRWGGVEGNNISCDKDTPIATRNLKVHVRTIHSGKLLPFESGRPSSIRDSNTEDAYRELLLCVIDHEKGVPQALCNAHNVFSCVSNLERTSTPSETANSGGVDKPKLPVLENMAVKDQKKKPNIPQKFLKQEEYASKSRMQPAMGGPSGIRISKRPLPPISVHQEKKEEKEKEKKRKTIAEPPISSNQHHHQQQQQQQKESPRITTPSSHTHHESPTPSPHEIDSELEAERKKIETLRAKNQLLKKEVELMELRQESERLKAETAELEKRKEAATTTIPFDAAGAGAGTMIRRTRGSFKRVSGFEGRPLKRQRISTVSKTNLDSTDEEEDI